MDTYNLIIVASTFLAALLLAIMGVVIHASLTHPNPACLECVKQYTPERCAKICAPKH